MEHIDDLPAVLIDLPILETYASRLEGLITEYRHELCTRGWKTYKPYTDGVSLKYGVAKSDFLEAYAQLLCQSAGLYMEFSKLLRELKDGHYG